MTTETIENVPVSGAAADLLEKRRQRQDIRKGNAPSPKDAAELAPISEAATLGLAESYSVGNPAKPLRIQLRAPIIAHGRKLYQQIQRDLPDIFLGATLCEPAGKGLDLAKVAAFWNAQYDESVKSGAVSEGDKEKHVPATMENTQAELTAFTASLYAYEPDTAQGEGQDADAPKHVLESFSDIVWQLADGFNEGLTREQIPNLLLEHLRPADFADLTRAIFKACSGTDVIFDGSLYDSF